MSMGMINMLLHGSGSEVMYNNKNIARLNLITVFELGEDVCSSRVYISYMP